jgi:hypothetical protein
VKGLSACLSGTGSVLNNKFAGVFFIDANVSRSDRINNFLIDSPDLVPLHKVVVLGGSLIQHELLESINGHTLAHDTLHGGETRIVPSFDVFLVDEPVQLTLGEYGGSHTQF